VHPACRPRPLIRGEKQIDRRSAIREPQAVRASTLRAPRRDRRSGAWLRSSLVAITETGAS
jgi:hypothetical protein